MKDLVEIGPNECGGIDYKMPGRIELSSIDGEDLAKLKFGDTITDRFGNGQTVYVHRCEECGRVLFYDNRLTVPAYCPACVVSETVFPMLDW